MAPGRVWLDPLSRVACAPRVAASFIPDWSGAPSALARRLATASAPARGRHNVPVRGSVPGLPAGLGAPKAGRRHRAGGQIRAAAQRGFRGGAADAQVKERTWEETLEALEGLITKRHRERLQTDSIEAMEDYLGRLGLDVGQLSVIHVAGTKGKGSTCTMAESILRSKAAPRPTARAGGPCVLRAA